MSAETNKPIAFTPARRVRRAIGWFGVLLAAPFFLWLVAGLLPGVPSMLEVFGLVGLRTPAAFAIGGLLLGAFGFHES